MLPIQKELRSHKEPKRAKEVVRFFQTGKGQYGEGDIFLGLTVPLTRMIVKTYKDMNNWDLVDTSAYKLIGVHLRDTVQDEGKILKKLTN